MKQPKDKFSTQAAAYKKFRPTYPPELIENILKFVKQRGTCWDCGTGNGQVAVDLANYFEKIYATDISTAQIKNTVRKDNIFYSVQRAEQTNFPDATFDLITVAQALHWFDFSFFNIEVKRVLKNDGILAVWGYGLLKIEPEIDKIIHHFYTEIIGPYWNKERKHIDNAYQSIEFDLNEIKIKKQFFIKVQWSLEHLEGYLNSWSSVQNYIETNNENPVPELIKKVESLWVSSIKPIRFPIFIRVFSNT